jgi:hypothetical protein
MVIGINITAEELFGQMTCMVRLSELKKCVEEIPPINDYVSEISLERDQNRYVVFAAPVVPLGALKDGEEI